MRATASSAPSSTVPLFDEQSALSSAQSAFLFGHSGAKFPLNVCKRAIFHGVPPGVEGTQVSVGADMIRLSGLGDVPRADDIRPYKGTRRAGRPGPPSTESGVPSRGRRAGVVAPNTQRPPQGKASLLEGGGAAKPCRRESSGAPPFVRNPPAASRPSPLWQGGLSPAGGDGG